MNIGEKISTMSAATVVSGRRSEEIVWFQEFVSKLGTGFSLDINILDQELKTLIKSLLEMDSLSTLSIIREESEKYYAKRVVLEFWNSTFDIHNSIRTAFDFYGKGLFIWVETADGDIELEQKCSRLIESLNATYFEKGLEVTGFIVEAKDKLRFPPEYITA
jgi:hypothetical protein